MKTEELKQQYDEMTSRIASARMYDGRNSGVDVYVCDKCGHKFYTRYKDKGVTPFTIKCRHCQHGTMAHDDTISEQIANVMGFNVHNWVRPTFDQLQQLNKGAIVHVLNGGLMLDDVAKPKHPKDDLLNRKLMDFPFSVRSLNLLTANDIITVRDLVKLNKTDWLKFRNGGKKSLMELDDFITEHGLSWGMNV